MSQVLEGDDYLDQGVAFAEGVATAPVDPRRVSKMPVKVDQNTPAILQGDFDLTILIKLLAFLFVVISCTNKLKGEVQ